MYKTVPLEIIYLYLLINLSAEGKFKPLINFMERNTLSDIKIYDIAKKILFSTFNLDDFKNSVIKNKKDLSQIANYISKIKTVLSIYIKNQIETKNLNDALGKIKRFINLINQYEDIEIVNYFRDIAKFINKKIKKHGLTVEYMALYIFFEEYMDLFIKAKEIIYNSDFINEQFEQYFKLLNVYPNNLIFVNDEENIKIMQNILPQKCFDNILNLSGCKYNKLQEQYFLIEIDKKIASSDKMNCIPHEVGHLLNLIIFNTQPLILNKLYLKDKTVDVTILNNWLNEVIADIIGSFISSNDEYYKNFDFIDECGENDKYPPTKFRQCLLQNTEYDFSVFKNQTLKKVAETIYNNINDIKEMLSIMKHDT